MTYAVGKEAHPYFSGDNLELFSALVGSRMVVSISLVHMIALIVNPHFVHHNLSFFSAG